LSVQHPTRPRGFDPKGRAVPACARVIDHARQLEHYGQMLEELAAQAGPTLRQTIGTRRVCRHCGTPAAIAAEQAEPICNQGGLVGGHSYVEVPITVAS